MRGDPNRSPCIFVSFVPFVVKESQIPEPRMTKPTKLSIDDNTIGNSGSRKKRKRTQRPSVVRGPGLL